MAEAIVMPKLGLTMQTGTVTRWSVTEGERVAAGSAVAEITTEKITYVLEAPVEGVLLKVVVPVDGEAPIGATIGIFGQLGDDIASLLLGATGRGAEAVASPASAPSHAPGPALPAHDSQPSPPVSSGARVPASPAARKRAAELGLDLARVSGTGPGGRVTIDDVNLEAEGEAASLQGPETGATMAVPSPPAVGASSRALLAPIGTGWTVPSVMTQCVRADAHALMELVATLNAHREGYGDISITAAMVKAVAASLRERPRMTATVDGAVIREGNGIDVGVAVAVPDGVGVTVVRDAAAKSLGEVSREIAALGLPARGDTVMPGDVLGGTFTVVDMSGFGSVDWSTTLVNRGEASILGVGRIVDEVVAIDGSPTVRPTVGLSLTFDHRVIDWASAADFLAVLLEHLARPVRMLV